MCKDNVQDNTHIKLKKLKMKSVERNVQRKEKCINNNLEQTNKTFVHARTRLF